MELGRRIGGWLGRGSRRVAVGRIKGRCSFELSRDGGARGIEGGRVANEEESGARAAGREEARDERGYRVAVHARGVGRRGAEPRCRPLRSGWLEWSRRGPEGRGGRGRRRCYVGGGDNEQI